ncbi:C2 domain protein [Trichuris suis]|nr:C2 domain protein [Trichuris suis]
MELSTMAALLLKCNLTTRSSNDQHSCSPRRRVIKMTKLSSLRLCSDDTQHYLIDFPACRRARDTLCPLGVFLNLARRRTSPYKAVGRRSLSPFLSTVTKLDVELIDWQIAKFKLPSFEASLGMTKKGAFTVLLSIYTTRLLIKLIAMRTVLRLHPFVRITLDQNGVVQTKQTRIIRGTSNPVFKEAVMFLISSKADDLQNMKLLVSVIDAAGSRTSNEVIGQVMLSSMAEEKSCLEQWRNMLQSPGKEVKASHSLKAVGDLTHPL